MTNYSAFHCQPENKSGRCAPYKSEDIHSYESELSRADIFVFTDFVGDLFLSCAVLFSDAEITEDVSKDFVGGDFADDGAEVVYGFSDVLGDEVGRDGEGETFLSTEEGGAGIRECQNVTLVCDQGSVTVCEEVSLGCC